MALFWSTFASLSSQVSQFRHLYFSQSFLKINSHRKSTAESSYFICGCYHATLTLTQTRWPLKKNHITTHTLDLELRAIQCCKEHHSSNNEAKKTIKEIVELSGGSSDYWLQENAFCKKCRWISAHCLFGWCCLLLLLALPPLSRCCE